MAGKKKWQDIDNPFATQPSLFPPSVGKSPYPPILRDKEGFLSILENIPDGVGLDYEGKDLGQPGAKNPSIIGIANREKCAALPGDPELSRLVLEAAQKKGVQIVGHSVIASDKPALEQELGIRTSLELWDDTIIRHYLCNSDFTKTPGKDEDDDDSGVMGMMNLWTMASLYTDLPNWKMCRGRMCDGPCPVCWPYEYCSLDAYAGLEAKFGTQVEMVQKGIPESLNDDLKHLSDICYRMQVRGIAVDWTYVAEMEKNFEEKKMEIFPFEMVNDKPVFTRFNPRSGVQVTKYFKDRGVQLKSTDKNAVRKALEKLAKGTGHTVEQLEGADDLPEVVDSLYRLYQYKTAGKGLTSWFNDKYRGRDGFIHPRFIVPGTSMGRLASSGPNFQNIPARGFGALVRRAIVPRDRGFDIVKVDYSQLELRMILYLAGVDPKDIKGDAFQWLVKTAGVEKFQRSAKMMFGDKLEGIKEPERQVAKSVSHGNSYLESFKVIKYADLDLLSTKRQIEAGALRIYGKKWGQKHDWDFRGGLVAFTGVNLAERLFGDKTFESRKKALEMQEDMFNAAFPQIREWHWKLLQKIENSDHVQSPIGRYLPLYGSPEDDAKMAAAFHGQGISADFVQEKMLRFDREMGVIALLQCHDELCFEVPSDWSDKAVVEHLQIMTDESIRLPGFVSALKMKRGKSWLETEMKQICPVEE